ncbi:ferritin family protein [Natranaerobius trueperi]|uniref:Rubrerythrin family protein n=1 Tax=Natranaerobius trueperi TaxID=759412 RepID=A0A226C2M2_9FIRM|nr:ferritin family protein [Natranaerobius trueperi]OWZ84874.1 rubrerythrin family protein [Natranaerobius trueperi]
MTNSLSQKEQQLLQEAKEYEELCVAKYQTYANQLSDQELSNLFQKLADKERSHYDQIDQILQQYGQQQQN